MESSEKLRSRQDAGPDSEIMDQQNSNETIDLRQIIGKFRAQKSVILICVIVCVALAFISARLITPTYTGEALVMIKPQQANQLATNASVQAAIQGGPEAVPTEAIVLQSRTLAYATIEYLHLDRDPDLALPSQNEVLPANGEVAVPEETASTPAANKTAMVNAFLKRLRIDMEPHSNVIRVSFRSSRPATAAQVPNALIQLYLERLTSEKNNELLQASRRLDDVLPALREKALYSEADRRLYEQYLVRSEEIHHIIGQERADAVIVSRADVPLIPSFPSIRLMVLAAAGIGAALGIVLVIVIDAWVGGLRNIEQVENTLGVRCLGAIPKLKRRRRDRLRGPPLLESNTAFSHAVRAIQLKLRSTDSPSPSRTILVTAALPGEAKSWTAACLAASLVADGFSVAVIDCDFYRPSVHLMLGGVRAPGLTDFLEGHAPLDQIIHADEKSGVSYLPAGEAASGTGARRIRTERLRQLIADIAGRYSFVIIDSAPVLAVSNSIDLSQIAKRTLLVVKWGSTGASVVRHALRQLREAGAPDVAVLLSMMDVKRAASYGDALASTYKQLERYYSQRSSA